MPRPYTGKITVGESRTTLKNGVIYVYERTTKYDQETQKTLTTGRRLKGKILPGTTEIVPTRPKKKSSVNKEGENLAPNSETKASSETKAPSETKASYTRVGMTRILNWVGQESGITAALRKCCQAQRILPPLGTIKTDPSFSRVRMVYVRSLVPCLGQSGRGRQRGVAGRSPEGDERPPPSAGGAPRPVFWLVFGNA